MAKPSGSTTGTPLYQSSSEEANQVTHLKDIIRAKDKEISELKDELLVVYRRFYYYIGTTRE